MLLRDASTQISHIRIWDRQSTNLKAFFLLFPYSLGCSQTQAIPSLLRVSWSCFDATQLSQGNLPSPCIQSTCLGVPTECSPYARCQVHCSEQTGVDTCPQGACNQRTSRLKATTLSLKVFSFLKNREERKRETLSIRVGTGRKKRYHERKKKKKDIGTP